MLMTYRDGRTAEDDLFDQPEDVQRAYIAQCMNLNPSTPEDWPMGVINNMLALRRLDGRKRFYKELGRMLSIRAR
jgi:hypothetical protein